MTINVKAEDVVPFFSVLPNPFEEMEYEQKHGKPRAFKTPQKLWEKAVEYFEHVEANPLLTEDFKGKDARKIINKHKRPFTINSFLLFAGVSERFFLTLKSEHKPGSKDYDEWRPYLVVIKEIERICREQKFDGAASGIFNANIIARDIGLFETTQHQTIDEDGNPSPIKTENKTVMVLPSNGREVDTSELEDSQT